MVRYHINPKTMEPLVCRAAEGRCPYGETTVHIGEGRVGEHFRIYESVMADFTLASFTKRGGKAHRTYDHRPQQLGLLTA